jgi:hypothetical protein
MRVNRFVASKADLFHLNLTHEALNWVTYADHP